MEIMTKEIAIQRIPELESICKVRATSMMLADLSACYFTLDDPERALPLSVKAWEKNKSSGIGMNLALILKDLGRHQEAFQVVEESYWLSPDDFYIRLGYGEALLKNGFWKQAWPIYSNARPTQQGAALDLRLPACVREWQGQPLGEKETLLVINEGGTGDRINYPRFLFDLTKRGINWKFYPYTTLASIFLRIFPREKLVLDGDDITATHWVTAFDLPAKLDIGPNEICSPLPVTASPEHIKKYIMSVPDGRPIIGLCWEAAEAFQGGRRVRSMTRGQASRLVCMTGDKVHWISLQHGGVADYPCTIVPFQTWEDTLGLIHNLDAVVSVDTSILHIAGSMGKSTAGVLSANACWKYLLNGSKCVWYPSVKLFRNPVWGVDQAIDQLIGEIRSGVWPPKT